MNNHIPRRSFIAIGLIAAITFVTSLQATAQVTSAPAFTLSKNVWSERGITAGQPFVISTQAFFPREVTGANPSAPEHQAPGPIDLTPFESGALETPPQYETAGFYKGPDAHWKVTVFEKENSGYQIIVEVGNGQTWGPAAPGVVKATHPYPSQPTLTIFENTATYGADPAHAFIRIKVRKN